MIILTINQSSIPAHGYTNRPPKLIYTSIQDVFSKHCNKTSAWYDSKRKITEIEIMKDYVIAVFKHCVVRVQKYQCHKYKSKRLLVMFSK